MYLHFATKPSPADSRRTKRHGEEGIFRNFPSFSHECGCRPERRRTRGLQLGSVLVAVKKPANVSSARDSDVEDGRGVRSHTVSQPLPVDLCPAPWTPARILHPRRSQARSFARSLARSFPARPLFSVHEKRWKPQNSWRAPRAVDEGEGRRGETFGGVARQKRIGQIAPAVNSRPGAKTDGRAAPLLASSFRPIHTRVAVSAAAVVSFARPKLMSMRGERGHMRTLRGVGRGTLASVQPRGTGRSRGKPTPDRAEARPPCFRQPRDKTPEESELRGQKKGSPHLAKVRGLSRYSKR